MVRVCGLMVRPTVPVSGDISCAYDVARYVGVPTVRGDVSQYAAVSVTAVATDACPCGGCTGVLRWRLPPIHVFGRPPNSAQIAENVLTMHSHASIKPHVVFSVVVW